MSDYISRQAAITLLSNVPQVDDLTITLTEKEREKYAEKFLSVIPAADVVEVVRCKDCKWRGKAGCAIDIVDETDEPKDDDFCSYGERADNGN